LFAKIGELGGEGIVSKRVDAPYTSGPSSTWLKTKHAEVGTPTARRSANLSGPA
jgi:ATP-dependent DNA ligase